MMRIGIGAQVHSSNVVEDLGQISYIFSDKTGTLTQNQMKWKEFVIETQLYFSIATSILNAGKGTVYSCINAL